MLCTILSIFTHILQGTHSPSEYTISQCHSPKFVSEIHVWVTSISWLQFELLVQLVQDRYVIIMDAQNFVHITKDIIVLLKSVVRYYLRLQP